MQKGAKIAIIALSVAVGIVLLLFLCPVGVCVILIASQYGNGETVDGIFMAYSKLKNDAFAGSYLYESGEMSFTVPDEYCGYKVTHLGGYYGMGLPCPFGVELPNEYNGLECLYTSASRLDDVETETLFFTVNLGKNVSEITNVSDMDCYFAYGEVAPDGGEDTVLKYYKVEYYFVVSSDNQYFYASEDGVLRNKSDGSQAILFE